MLLAGGHCSCCRCRIRCRCPTKRCSHWTNRRLCLLWSRPSAVFLEGFDGLLRSDCNQESTRQQRKKTRNIFPHVDPRPTARRNRSGTKAPAAPIREEANHFPHFFKCLCPSCTVLQLLVCGSVFVLSCLAFGLITFVISRPSWPRYHRMCVIAKRLGCLCLLAHAAGCRHFFGPSTTTAHVRNSSKRWR